MRTHAVPSENECERRLTFSTLVREDASVLTVRGILDHTTYLRLRDTIIKAALDCPPRIVIDVTRLNVSAPSAWSVFTSARWHVSQWPDVPMALVCAHREGRDGIARSGVNHYVPVYESTWEAIAALAQGRGCPIRRRRRFELAHHPASVKRARDLVREALLDWTQPKLIPVAKLVASVLVENVLAHTDSAPTIRIEFREATGVLVVAVEDGSAALAARRELSDRGGDEVSGLSIVAALCRKWGNSPTPSGKTIWAAIGPENQL
jgi:hypothetical protein